jgi:hypothetical protein
MSGTDQKGLAMEPAGEFEARAQRRSITRRVRRVPQKGFDAPTFDDDDREIVIGGGDDKPATP